MSATSEDAATVTASSDCEGTLEIDFNTIAFVLTAFVGMVQYVVQQRIRRNDAIEEEGRRFAAAAAARVRLQMSEFTMKAMLLANRIRLTYYIIFKDFFPALWDAAGMEELEVGEHNIKYWNCRAEMTTGYIFRNPYIRYPEATLREIAEDPTTMKQYVVRHRKLAKLYLALRDLCLEKGHLIELPDWDVRDKMWPVFADGHQKTHVGPTIVVTEFMLFADEWERILDAWDADDFTKLQPDLPNPMPLLGLLLAIGNVGLAKKQVELEGSSSSQGGTYKVSAPAARSCCLGLSNS